MEKFIIKRLRAAAAVFLILSALTGTTLAAGELIPGGEPIGIQVAVDGVLVADVNEVETSGGAVCPAREAGIRPGDVIVSVSGCAVDSAQALADAVKTLDGETEVVVLREGRSRRFLVSPAIDAEGNARLGLWLRDGVSGIGTLTFVDPETGAFGALGHGVNEPNAGTLLPASGGSVCRAQVVDIRRGEPGLPGELAGRIDAGTVLGRIDGNTDAGLFGVLSGDRAWGEAIPVAAPEEVRNGEATILACVAGQNAREYDVEIARTGLIGGGRDLTVRVTDPELLALTGGIVQGMSGSPILQDGRLVGAVTHVLVGDPRQGYGIFITHMLAAANAA